jgi:hypothetical protein
MADINVERKRPSLVPWLVGLILLALLVWAAAKVLGGDDQTTPPAQSTTVQ